MDSSYDISTVVYQLRSGVTSLDERVIALRLLKDRIDASDTYDASGGAEGEPLDSYNRKRLKQLLLDSILKIVLSEDTSASFRKRQMVRSELLIMLSGVLESNTLFGSILHEPAALQRKMIALAQKQEEASGEGFDLDDSSQASEATILSDATLIDEESIPDSLSDISHADRPRPVMRPPGGYRIKHSASETGLGVEENGDEEQNVTLSASLKTTIEKRRPPMIPPDVKILKPLIVKHAKMQRRHKFLQPRPSVLHNDKVLADSFVPGVDPLNYFEQDRKLGYQKPRMWFPGVEATVKPTLLPANATDGGGSDEVVREFLQMRALASYLGDLVQPYEPSADTYLAGKSSPKKDRIPKGHPLAALRQLSANRLQQKHLLSQSLPYRAASEQRDGRKGLKLSSSQRLVPYNGRNSTDREIIAAAPASNERKGRLSGVTDLHRFRAALEEVTKVWSPLIGMHLPMKQLEKHFRHGPDYARQLRESDISSLSQQERKRKLGLLAYQDAFMTRNKKTTRRTVHGQPEVVLGTKRLFSRSTDADIHDELMPFKSLKLLAGNGAEDDEEDMHNGALIARSPSVKSQSGTLSPSMQRSAAWRKRRRMQDSTAGLMLNVQSPSSKLPISKLLGTGKDISAHSSNYIVREQTRQYQREVSRYFEEQRQSVAASLRATEAIIESTIKAQYNLLHPNYIVLLEGSKADSRRLLARTLLIFCRVRRKNLLAMAFGVWKIAQVLVDSAARRPKYARVAACHLMARWLLEVHLKKLRVWLTRWRRRAGMLIFMERSHYAIIIQTLYRHWRDRRKLIAMHRAGPWHGVLSDVFLAPKRESMTFFVPDIIRTERRLLWLAATIIQTAYRCWIQSREYFLRRRQLILIQSLIRMYPKYRKFRRLKRTTIRCQAWARRTVKWKQYRRMKRAAVIVQKYTRRFLETLHKWVTLRSIWSDIEQRLVAAIRIQCRWRIHVARQVLHKRQLVVEMRHYSALVIQRNYYRYRRAFHTFFLMCALRQRGDEDVKLQQLATRMGKYKAARVIQRYYKMRFFRRNITSIVMVQCWFRGRLGYNLVDMMRRERWAQRKLRHWGRVRVQRLHRYARRIQRCWLYAKSKRMLRHLWWRRRHQDRLEDYERSEVHYRAAGRIQAYVKGVWDRRWVRQFRAKLIIQRNARFYFALKRWRRMKREYVRMGVENYVAKFMNKVVLTRTGYLVALHSAMLRKPQALVRGFLVRSMMQRAREFAYSIGLAAVRIQRFWRMSGAKASAVEEVMALRRAKSNPFLHCKSYHEVLVLLQQECKAYYSCSDPRVGLKVSSLLYRLGCSELLEVFPRKHYMYAKDMASLNMERLSEMFNLWKSRLSRTKSSSDMDAKDAVAQAKKAKHIPVQQFELLLDVVRPPIKVQHTASDAAKVSLLSHLSEVFAPQRAAESVKKAYLKRFGKHLHARADHLGRDVVHLAWDDYNNFKCVGTATVTRGQIIRAIQTAPESTAVMARLAELREPHAHSAEEFRWDCERTEAAANILQLAMDSALLLLPVGSLRDEIERAVYRVSSYRRKIAFLKGKMGVAPVNPDISSPSGKRMLSPSGKHTISVSRSRSEDSFSAAHASDTPITESTQHIKGSNVYPVERMGEMLKVSETLDFIYTGSGVELDLELNVSVCKVYGEVLNRHFVVSMGIQSLKNKWSNDAIKRAMAAEKMSNFLSNVTQGYLDDVRQDKVRNVWNKFRRAERSKQRMRIIMDAVRRRKAYIQHSLTLVPRYGCECYEDENGYPYWVDYNPGRRVLQESKALAADESVTADSVAATTGGDISEANARAAAVQYISSYDMPQYSFDQWMYLLRIQRRVRIYNVGARARRLQREEEERQEIARQQAILEEERRRGRMHVTLKCFVRGRLLTLTTAAPQNRKASTTAKPLFRVASYKRSLSPVNTGTSDAAVALKKKTKKVDFVESMPAKESLLPWRYRFEQNPLFTPGVWALLRTFPDSVGTGHGHGNRHGQRVPGSKPNDGGTDFDLSPSALKQLPEYQVVVVFSVRPEEGICDVRTVRGNRIRNVSMRRLCQMNLDVGTAVEVRYKQQQVFYRAKILHVDNVSSNIPSYRIEFEDGEKADNLHRDAIRPSSSTLASFLRSRIEATMRIHRQYKRMEHFERQRRLRVSRGAERAIAAYNDSRKKVMQRKTMFTFSPRAADTVAEGGEDAMSEITGMPDVGEGDGVLAIEDAQPALHVTNEISTALTVVTPAAESPNASMRHTPRSRLPAGEASIKSAMASPKRHAPTVVYRTELSVRLIYSKTPLLLGWREYKDENGTVYYVHAESRSVTEDIPTYEAHHIHAARRIQMKWFIHNARIALRNKVYTFDMFDIIASTTKKCSKIAHVGYELEGVTPLQILRRAGFWEIADVIDGHYKALKQPIANLTIEEIANKPREEADTLGIAQPLHLKDLREFQTWWHKSTYMEKQKRLALLNYYTDPYEDKRTLHQCIMDSEEIIVRKFTRVIKTSVTRTRTACRAMLMETLFPHSHLQIDNFLRKYGDKPELARDCIFELINKHTVHTYQEERQVLRHYLQTCQLLSGIVGVLKIKSLKKTITDTVEKAKELCRGLQDDSSRAPVTGPEAKAAWLIRRDILQYISNLIQAAVVAQRNVRCFLLSKRWKEHLAARMKATAILQRCMRRFLAYRNAAMLREQRSSEWEQLWDARRNLLYYYNTLTGASQYDEPPGYFRPLVRDPKTAMLMQAWPNDGDGDGLAPSSRYTALVGMSTHAMCGICNVRRCDRICKECVDEVNGDPQKNYAFPYCFACFMKEHSEDKPWKIHHDFQQVVTSEDSVPMLRCAVCDEPATRKCLGTLDDAQLEDIMSELSNTKPEKWMQILEAANIGGQRKLEMLMEQAQLDKAALSAPALSNMKLAKQSGALATRLELLRSQLDRLRAECDECYCATCYQDVHSGGKRAAHKWKGFIAGATVCSVCSNSPAESTCLDCESSPYCSSCFKVFHSMGRKRKHKKAKILETLEEGQEFCEICQRRAGTVSCETDRCQTVCCDSCYEFKHKPQCQRNDVVKSGRHSPSKQPEGNRPPSPVEIMEGGCVVCGEIADQKCVQCGDLYCSRTWMGNPGCFLSHHSKGNRASHTTERYFYRKPLTASRRREMQLARRESKAAQMASSRTML